MKGKGLSATADFQWKRAKKELALTTLNLPHNNQKNKLDLKKLSKETGSPVIRVLTTDVQHGFAPLSIF